MTDKWKIELTSEQLSMISNALEFTSRFSCGQIGSNYLPWEIQNLFTLDSNGNAVNWEIGNKRREMFDSVAQILKTTLHPDLSPSNNGSYGVSRLTYSDNLYDIYKMINHRLKTYNDLNTAPNEILHNVNSYFTKFGNLPNIKVDKIDDE